MTNEEAIKLIDDRMCFGRGKWSEHHRPVIDEYWQAGEMAIKALEVEPHWIPVEQELPETSDEVLTTYIVNGDRSKRYVETSSYYQSSESWSSVWDEFRIAGTRIEVIAWQPLSEPFKGVTE